jgi:hypothetical protein
MLGGQHAQRGREWSRFQSPRQTDEHQCGSTVMARIKDALLASIEMSNVAVIVALGLSTH